MSVVAGAATPPARPTLAQKLATTFIVEAKVVAMEEIADKTPPPWPIARLKITRVYCGEGVKVGEPFVAQVLQFDPVDEPDAQGHHHPPPPPPIPNLGDVGIWRIQPSKGLWWLREDDSVRFRGTTLTGDWMRGMDDSHSIICGDLLSAYYGFVFLAEPDVANFKNSTVHWELWGLQQGQTVVDSQARDPYFSGDPGTDFSWEPS